MMNKFQISCEESRIEHNRSFYGCFSLGPFEDGQSLTFANALRRTLLSECSSIGIISATIENVTHEYSTLPGVRESVIDILLNFKEIVLKRKQPLMHLKKDTLGKVYEQVGSSYIRPFTGYLKIKGPGVVRAKDLRLPPFIQCVDGDQYIATLAEDGFLNMKFIMMEGKGYLIQKNEIFIDYTLVKRRREFLKKLFVKEFKVNLSCNKNLVKKKDKYKTLNNQANRFFKNARPLNLDTIFNPVIKVNYVIEENENKLVEDAMRNGPAQFVDEVSSLMESSYYLKTQFPFLWQEKTPFAKREANLPCFSTPEGCEGTGGEAQPQGEGAASSPSVKTDKLNQLDTSSGFVYKKKDEENVFYNISGAQLKPLLRNPAELEILLREMHPLKKRETSSKVLLEIWTNGSLHPREALAISLKKLASMFLNLEKTKKYNSIFQNESSYKKSI